MKSTLGNQMINDYVNCGLDVNESEKLSDQEYAFMGLYRMYTGYDFYDGNIINCEFKSDYFDFPEYYEGGDKKTLKFIRECLKKLLNVAYLNCKELDQEYDRLFNLEYNY